jgi:hypothetical protein
VGGKYTDFSGAFETLGQRYFEGPSSTTLIPWTEGTKMAAEFLSTYLPTVRMLDKLRAMSSK